MTQILAKVKKFRNLTAHPITVINERGDDVLVLPPEKGYAARVRPLHKKFLTTVDGVKIVQGQNIAAENLPNPEDGTIFIVSQAVKLHASDRDDLVVPSDTVYEGGRVIGCRELSF